MQDFITKHLETLIANSYANAYAQHGDLSFGPDDFASRLYSIVEKRLGASASASAAFEFVNRLHLNDLYLTLACAQGGEAAWSHFASTYDKSISRICRRVCASIYAATDMAGNMLGRLFLPDDTGHPRIASYTGLCPLAAWLAIVIRRLAERERNLEFNKAERIDQILDLVDEAGVVKIEAALRAYTYGPLIKDTLRCAVVTLSDRERAILSLRYEQELQVSHIARLLGVRPHAITQQIYRSSQKLRKQIISILATRHKLAPAAIEECLTDLISNPENSVPRLWG